MYMFIYALVAWWLGRTSSTSPVGLKSATLPASLDVKLANSYVMLSMSGMFDGQEVSARDMWRSALAREFCRFTRDVSYHTL